ncbi:hypothetical protein [Enterovibrio calviensis]|uniref:hypothetical protein n=1 Tax=Enterovibrio calviensis TaxID=91359 RepID=UPI003735C742
MILTRHNVLRFLLSNNCITLRELLDESWEVVDHSSKNNNFSFISSSRGFFIKQYIPEGERFSYFGLKREYQCYLLAEDLGALNEAMPKAVCYFDDDNILITEYVTTSMSIFSYFREVDGDMQEIASLLGEELSKCHFLLSQSIKFSDNDVQFSSQKPSIFSPKKMSEGRELSLAQKQCIGILEKHRNLMDGLISLDAEWKVNGLIHNDMKLENCLVRFNTSKHISGVTFLDWEGFNTGDIAWDLAGIIEGYLTLLSSAMQRQAKKTHLFDHSKELSEISGQVRASLRVFWASYIEGSKIDAAYVKVLLKRVAKYSAARLIQSTYNKLENRNELSLDALLQIQLAHNLLAEPELNRQKLFGF